MKRMIDSERIIWKPIVIRRATWWKSEDFWCFRKEIVVRMWKNGSVHITIRSQENIRMDVPSSVVCWTFENEQDSERMVM